MTIKRFYLFLIIPVLELVGCKPIINTNNIVPSHVDKFATGFISELHNGNIENCLVLVHPEMNNEKGRQFLTTTFYKIKPFLIDSFRMINANRTIMYGDDGFTNYSIDYEYFVGDKFLYFNLGISEQNNRLKITQFDYKLMDESFSKLTAFSFENKDFTHYLFLAYALLIPIFIIITLIFVIQTKLYRKWLWIVGCLIGFMKFSINWTTGQVGFKLIGISFLGAGFTKAGDIAPWIITFSIPIIAIIFWLKRYLDKKEARAKKLRVERIKEQESKDDIL